jgi:hypothetical protein
LAEFSVAIEVFHCMIICVGDCVGGADKGTGEAGDAIFDVFDHTEPLFRIQLKKLGRADVDAQLASPA